MIVDQGRNSEEAMKRQVALEAGRQLVRDLRQASATGRLVIELKTAMALQGTDLDLVLKDKDRLHIPKKPDFVVVLGQVHNPTAFQFISGKKGKHYIELAGGKTRFADGKRIHVVRADGSVRKDGQDVTLLPGDVVIIPETLERFSMMEFMLDLSQVVYQLGLAAASAKTIGVLN